MSPAPMWRTSTTMTGAASGVLGLGAGSAHLLNAGPGAVIWLCGSSALCAITAGTVAIVGTIAGRTPDVRRMAALQHLARKANSPSERRSAMGVLALDKLVSHGQLKAAALLAPVLLPEAKRLIVSPPEPSEEELAAPGAQSSTDR